MSDSVFVKWLADAICSEFDLKKDKKNGANIIAKCKSEKLCDLDSFLQKYGHTTDGLMNFLSSLSLTNVTCDGLSFICDKLKFYFDDDLLQIDIDEKEPCVYGFVHRIEKSLNDDQTVPNEICAIILKFCTCSAERTEQLIKWHSRIIVFVKTCNYVKAMVKCIKDKEYDGKKLIDGGRRAFEKDARSYRVPPGAAHRLFKVMIEETKEEDGIDVVLSKVSSTLFMTQMKQAKYDIIAKRIKNYVPSIAECDKIENIQKFIVGIKVNIMNNESVYIALMNEIKLCFALHRII